MNFFAGMPPKPSTGQGTFFFSHSPKKHFYCDIEVQTLDQPLLCKILPDYLFWLSVVQVNASENFRKKISFLLLKKKIPADRVLQACPHC